MKYKVHMIKRMYAIGEVTVDCDNHDQAIKMVESQKGKVELKKQ